MGLSFYDLAALPHQFDIVWCLYPRREDKLAPGPVVRPTLVLDVQVEQTKKIARLLVAYGTGEFNERHTGRDLIIDFVAPTYVAQRGVIAGALTEAHIQRLEDCLRERGSSSFLR